MNNNEVVVLNEDTDTQYMQIPIKKSDFGDFVTDLLGQPEIITYDTSEIFVATNEWLRHVHHLIDQRISQQSNSHLVDFSATFKYETGADRKVTTVPGFLNFNEAKLVRTERIILVWTYLIDFPNKDLPEKQEIIINLYTHRLRRKKESILFSLFRESTLAFTIKHTERTWGDDMHTLLEREFESIIEEEHPYKKIFTTISIFIAIGFFILGIYLPHYVEGLIKEKEIAKLYLECIPTGQSLSSMDVNSKIDFLIRLLDPINPLYKVSEYYKILSFGFGIFLAILTIFLFDKPRNSFILITSKDKEAKKKYDKKSKNSSIKSTLSFILAIGAGVLGNYLYYYLNLSQ